MSSGIVARAPTRLGRRAASGSPALITARRPMQLSGDLPRNRTMSTPSPVATRIMSLKDLELHCDQLQVLLSQLRSEKEFVEKENTQLREAMQGEEGQGRSAKISIWLDIERTRQAVRSPSNILRPMCARLHTLSHPPLRG